jgi:soluble cytochrome b562
MSSYIITVNERMTPGKSLMGFLKSLSKTTDFVDIVQQKERPANGIDEAIDDIKNGRITTYENFEEYQKGMRKILGDV